MPNTRSLGAEAISELGEDHQVCFILQKCPKPKAAFCKGRKEPLNLAWWQSPSWLEQKTSASLCDPFTWVLLVLACGGFFLFLDETGWVNLEWWPQEEIKLLTGDSTEVSGRGLRPAPLTSTLSPFNSPLVCDSMDLIHAEPAGLHVAPLEESQVGPCRRLVF